MESLYLRPNVKVEPLFDSWYAWPHLLPPATAARNITERHLKIMDSYIAAPQVHADAVKNPRMLGGPFIDYRGKRVPEIVELRDRTRRERANLIEMSNAIGKLNAMLSERAKGYSLQPLYPQVPPLLRGYVELVYDLKNNASFRLIESLLYRSKYFDRAAQSVMLSLITGDDRPFVLSTPRLESEESLELRMPFDDERIDWLFRLKRNPCTWDEIQARLNVHDRPQLDVLRSFLTHERPQRYESYAGKGIRWRYFGHACILIESAGVSMLFDPVLSYTSESEISRYTYDDLPESIDFVLITHNHPDHILLETLLQIRHKVKTLIVPQNRGGALQDPSLKLLLDNIGCKNVVELSEMQSIKFEGGSITGVPFLGEHADLDIRSKLGYWVQIKGHSLLIIADSCNIEPMLYEHLKAEMGKVDVLFVGMECEGAPLSWLYGPLLPGKMDRAMDESRRLSGCNYEQAMNIVECLGCGDVFVYAMGQEPWLNYVMSIKYSEESLPIVASNRLIRECLERGVNSERLFGEKEILIED